MSKYGSGVRMKDAIRMEMAEVSEALDRANVRGGDRKIVVDALAEAFYQWAMTNAAACAFEEYVQAADMDLYRQAVNPARSAAAISKKFAETYPEEWREMLDDDENGGV